jgi:hypothetical protein
VGLFALVAALHGGHAGGVGYGGIGLASSLLITAVLAISYIRCRKWARRRDSERKQRSR